MADKGWTRAVEVTSTPGIMGGEPCVAGTRIPAETIAVCLDAGNSDLDIYAAYPWMPLGGIEAVRRWKAAQEAAGHRAVASRRSEEGRPGPAARPSVGTPANARPVPIVEITSDPEVMSGEPCVAGTRIPAQVVIAYLDAGRSDLEIYEDYPGMPLGGIEAVRRWRASRKAAA